MKTATDNTEDQLVADFKSSKDSVSRISLEQCLKSCMDQPAVYEKRQLTLCQGMASQGFSSQLLPL